LGLGLITTQASNDTQEKRQARFKTIESVKNHGMATLAKEMPGVLTPDEALIPAIRTMILNSNPEGIVNALKGMADRPDFTEILPSINVPTLIVSGQVDTIVPKERIDMMAKLIQRNWIVEIPNGGHMPFMEAPELVAKGLLDLAQMIK
jgi:pimeloyl-ACP methyl ester carboxylesterase